MLPCCCAVLFGDIGKKAAGARGRNLVYGIIYSLDATRCVILHLAATQSLQHALGASAPPMWQCGLAVMVMAGIATQVWPWQPLPSAFLYHTHMFVCVAQSKQHMRYAVGSQP
jgi:hypothetical protein